MASLPLLAVATTSIPAFSSVQPIIARATVESSTIATRIGAASGPGSRSPRLCTAMTSSPGGIRQSQPAKAWRSEEHTSELQSLMRISYAVFCLKKKNKNKLKSKEYYTQQIKK